MQYRKDIDGLRAVAVLSVVLFHADESVLTGGFVGVDIFFVISGFLICRIIAQELAEDRFSILGFYERRARRILPALTAVIIFSILAGLLLYLPGDLRQLGQAVVASALFVSNFHFMTEVNYFAAPLESYSLLHLWSLAVEEQFYIITPIIMIMVYRFRPSLLAGLLALLSLISLIVSILLVDLYPKGAFYMLPSRFWEMGLGAVLGITMAKFPGRAMAHSASITGGLLIAGSILLIHNGPPFPGLMAVPPVVGAALVIWAGPEGAFNRLLSTTPAVMVGLISYSLYLWHWPILSLAKYYFIDDLTLAQTAIALAASFLAAYLSYRFVEQPFRRPSSDRTVKKILLGAGATIAALSIAGTTLTVQKGFPGRWTDEALAWGQISKLPPKEIRNGCAPISIEGLVEGETCVVGEPGQPYDFVVWGDSHAHAMRAGFAQLAQDMGTTGLVISKFACTSALGKRNRSMPFWLRCGEHNDAVLDYIERLETEDVILVSRWAGVDNIQFFSGEGAPFLSRILPIADTGDFESSVARTIAALRDHGKTVFWLKMVPGQTWHVPRAYSRVTQWGHELPPLRSRDDYEAEHAHVDAAFSATGDAIAISSADTLCDATLCAAARNGTTLYYDDDHISPYGATLLAAPIAEALSAAAR